MICTHTRHRKSKATRLSQNASAYSPMSGFYILFGRVLPEWCPREYLPLSLPLQCVAYQGPVWALLRSNVGVPSETLGKRRGPKCWEKIPWHKSRTWHGGKEMQGLLTIFASFIKRCNQSHNCQRVKRHQSRLLQLPSRHYHTRSHFMSFPSLALWSRMKTNYLFL